MNNKLQIRRALLLLVFLGAAFAGLGYRLVDLQVLRHDELSAKARAQHAARISPGPPARRYSGRRTAISCHERSGENDLRRPSLIGNQTAVVARAVAPLLQLDEAALAQKLTPRSFLAKNSGGQTVTNQLHYVRLAKNVSDETWQRVFAAMTNLTLA